MKPTIPKGYRITVVSWENDADNYNTKVESGLTKEEVAFKIDLCKALKHDGGVGNMYQPSDSELEFARQILKAVLVKHSEADEGDPTDEAADTAFDYLYDLGLSGGEFFTRVCESYKVEFVPTDIYIEDVTKEFE
jgi:hypothetical protein